MEAIDTLLSALGIRTLTSSTLMEWSGEDRPAACICNEPGYLTIIGAISSDPIATNDAWTRSPKGVAYPDYFKVSCGVVYRGKYRFIPLSSA